MNYHPKIISLACGEEHVEIKFSRGLLQHEVNALVTTIKYALDTNFEEPWSLVDSGTIINNKAKQTAVLGYPVSPSPFECTESFARYLGQHKIPRPPGTGWRTTEQVSGEIVGIPQSRGVLVGTNGILCLLAQSGGQHYTGHLNHFVPDEKEVEKKASNKSKKESKPKATKVKQNINELLTELGLE